MGNCAQVAQAAQKDLLESIASYTKGLNKRSSYNGEKIIAKQRDAVAKKESEKSIKQKELDELQKKLEILREADRKQKEAENRIREEKERIERERKEAIQAAWVPAKGDILIAKETFTSHDDQGQEITEGLKMTITEVGDNGDLEVVHDSWEFYHWISFAQLSKIEYIPPVEKEEEKTETSNSESEKKEDTTDPKGAEATPNT